MKKSIRLVGAAAAISFAGSLPLGTLNLTVANYAAHTDLLGARSFAAAAIVVEMLFMGLSLLTMGRLERFTRHTRFFRGCATAVLLLMAVDSLVAAWRMQPFHAGVPLPFLNPFAAGLILSAANPLHLPFWMGWTAVLRSKGILNPGPASRLIFIFAAATGTLLAFALYAVAGGRLIPFLASRQPLLNTGIGMILLFSGILNILPRKQRCPAQ